MCQMVGYSGVKSSVTNFEEQFLEVSEEKKKWKEKDMSEEEKRSALPWQKHKILCTFYMKIFVIFPSEFSL